MRLPPNAPGGALPTGEEKARAVRAMFDSIAGRYDLVNRVISLGMDAGWRRRAVRALALPRGSRVLDLACGTGDFCRELQRAGYRPFGIDFSWEMLANARATFPLVQADALTLPIRGGTADGVTCGFALRNVADLDGLFAEIGGAVRSGGRIALLEVAEPRSRVLRAGHALYFNRVVPLIGGALSNRDAYSYLPRSVAYLPPPDAIVRMLRARGFEDAARLLLSGGIAQVFVGTRA